MRPFWKATLRTHVRCFLISKLLPDVFQNHDESGKLKERNLQYKGGYYYYTVESYGRSKAMMMGGSGKGKT
jgi:hypothetical protein